MKEAPEESIYKDILRILWTVFSQPAVLPVSSRDPTYVHRVAGKGMIIKLFK